MALGVKDRKVIKLNPRKRDKIITAAIVAGALLGVWLIIKPNAYQIKINDEVIGAIKDKAVIEAAKDTVITQLEEEYKSQVRFEEDLEMKRYRAGKKDYISSNYLISTMRRDMEILIGFKELYIDNKSVGIIQSEETLDELKERLELKYYGKNIETTEFGKEVELKEVFAKESELISIDNLVKICSVTKPRTLEYEVKEGDSLSAIASRYNTTVNQIVASNPESEGSMVLRVGQKIKVDINEPLLPVTIIKEVDNLDQTTTDN